MQNVVQSNPNKKRNPLLDCCKGLGIVLVVMWHTHLLLPEIFSFFVFNLFFFCLAGVMVKPDNIVDWHNFWGYIKKIIQRYAKPYIFYNLLFLAFYNVFLKYNLITTDFRYAQAPHMLSFNEILHKAFYHITVLSRSELLSGGSWFLKSLFWGLLSYAIIMFIYNNVKKIHFLKNIKYSKIITYSCIALIGAIILHYTNIRNVYFYFQTLICIFIGDLIKPYIEKLNMNYPLLIMSICLMAIGNHIKIRYLMVTVFCVATFIFLYELSKVIKNLSDKIFNFFVFLGQNTIPILIFHYLAFKIVSYIYIYIYILQRIYAIYLGRILEIFRFCRQQKILLYGS